MKDKFQQKQGSFALGERRPQRRHKKITGGYDPWLHVSTLGHLPRWTKHHPKAELPSSNPPTRGELDKGKLDQRRENSEIKFGLYPPIKHQSRVKENLPVDEHSLTKNQNFNLPSHQTSLPFSHSCLYEVPTHKNTNNKLNLQMDDIHILFNGYCK